MGRMERIQAAVTAILALVFLLVMPVAMAKDGRVISSSGDVSIERSGQSVFPEEGTLLMAGDVVETGIDGHVLWQMADETLFILSNNSRFRIADYAFGSGKGKAVYELAQGGVRTHTGLISEQGGDYQHQTPYANISVNGTDYVSVSVSNDRAQSMQVKPGLYVFVREGSVSVANTAGSSTATADSIIFVANDQSQPQVVVNPNNALIELVNSGDFDFNLLAAEAQSGAGQGPAPGGSPGGGASGPSGPPGGGPPGGGPPGGGPPGGGPPGGGPPGGGPPGGGPPGGGPPGGDGDGDGDGDPSPS